MSRLGRIVIAVVGAAGKTGRAVVKALEARHEIVRPLVRLPAGWRGEVIVDLLDFESLRAGLRGVDAVYHTAPNMHPAELEMAGLIIRAASASGVAKLVYHSVLHPQLKNMPHHWEKLQVEEAVIESGLRWTILQPAPYVQNFARPDDGVIRVPYSTGAPFSFVDLLDVGEAAVAALTSPSFDSGIYELAGPSILTVGDLASALGVRAVAMDPVSWEQAALTRGMAPETARRLVAMFRHYDKHGLVGNPAALTMLIQRAPNNAIAALVRDLPPDP